MKKVIFTILYTGITFFTTAQSTIEDEYVYKLPNNIFKINPAAFANRTLQADYEMFFNRDKMSLQFSPKGTIYKDDNSSAYGLGFEMSYRKYLRDVFGRGKSHETLVYFYGSVGYSYYDTDFTTIDETNSYYNSSTSSWETETIYGETFDEHINKYTADIGFGLQFLVKRMISVDFNLGGGLRLADSNLSETNWDIWAGDYGHTGFVPKLSLAIGIVGEK